MTPYNAKAPVILILPRLQEKRPCQSPSTKGQAIDLLSRSTLCGSFWQHFSSLPHAAKTLRLCHILLNILLGPSCPCQRTPASRAAQPQHPVTDAGATQPASHPVNVTTQSCPGKAAAKSHPGNAATQSHPGNAAAQSHPGNAATQSHPGNAATQSHPGNAATQSHPGNAAAQSPVGDPEPPHLAAGGRATADGGGGHREQGARVQAGAHARVHKRIQLVVSSRLHFLQLLWGPGVHGHRPGAKTREHISVYALVHASVAPAAHGWTVAGEQEQAGLKRAEAEKGRHKHLEHYLNSYARMQ
eukprot:664144-Pelagomonas_calceolata.AAC.2